MHRWSKPSIIQSADYENAASDQRWTPVFACNVLCKMMHIWFVVHDKNTGFALQGVFIASL